MNRRIVASLGLLITTAILSTHLGLEVLDNRPIVTIDDVRVDLVGHLLEQINALKRDCAKVQVLLPDTSRHNEVRAFIETYSPPASSNPSILNMLSQDQWILTEVEFADLQTAVMLIEGPNLKLTGQQALVWSGPTAPWLPGPFIREWLAQHALGAPRALMNCFDARSKTYRPG